MSKDEFPFPDDFEPSPRPSHWWYVAVVAIIAGCSTIGAIVVAWSK